MMVCKLNVHSWNAKGISNKLREVREYINKQNVDIMFVTEIKIQAGFKITIC